MIIRVLLFTVPILTGFAWLWVSQRDRRRRFIHGRLTKLAAGGDEASPQAPSLRVAPPSSAIDRFLPQALRSRVDVELAAAGYSIGVLHLFITSLIAGLVSIGLTIRILALSPSLGISLAVVAAVSAPLMLVRVAQARYKGRFLDIFPDALDLIGRAIKAGLPVNEALVVAGKEVIDPVGGELRRSLDRVQLGVQVIDSLKEMADRIRVPDFRFMVVALALQQRSGGSLAETLASLSKVIRARKALRQKARGLSAEAKASAIVLAVMPFAVGGFMSIVNPDLMDALFFDPRGRFMIGVAFTSLVAGLLTMYCIIKRAVR
jgi:tight adherence protein B